jgi:hypothetical protein
MERLKRIGLIAGLVAGLMQAVPAAAQPRPLTDAECQSLRARLAEHAKLSDGVRRTVATRAAASPAPPPPSPTVVSAPVPAPVPPAPVANRADEIRARLQKIPVERQQAEDGRLGALGRFDFGRVAQYQGQLSTLDQEKTQLDQELASLPARPSAPAAPAAAPIPAPAPAAPAPVPVSDSDRIRCQEMQAAYDEAVRIRLRELGAKDGQAGVMLPLIGLNGQTAEQITRELAAQMPSGAPGSQVGLLDVNGDGRIDGFVDVPVKDVYRVYRQKPDGTLDVSVAGGPGAAYGDMARRLEETGNRQAGRSLADLLATRAAGPVRVTAETADFAIAHGHWLAGNFAEAARVEGAAARSMEFQNLRGEAVRVTEILVPVNGGVALRRLVAQPRPGDQEQWDETTTAVRPTSYSRTDVEIAQAREMRSTAGAAVGTRSTAAPIRFSLDR